MMLGKKTGPASTIVISIYPTKEDMEGTTKAREALFEVYKASLGRLHDPFALQTPLLKAGMTSSMKNSRDRF